ncbi:unnamed protein product [Tilletia controversa]|nr:unnamed protein product [Tilletia controversa]
MNVQRRYGHAAVVQNIFSAVQRHGNSQTISRFTQLVVPVLKIALDAEVGSAKKDASFESIEHVAGIQQLRTDQVTQLHQQRATLPCFERIARLLCGDSADGPLPHAENEESQTRAREDDKDDDGSNSDPDDITDEDEGEERDEGGSEEVDDDEGGSEEVDDYEGSASESGSSAEQCRRRAATMIVATAVRARSQRLNRLPFLDRRVPPASTCPYFGPRDAPSSRHQHYSQSRKRALQILRSFNAKSLAHARELAKEPGRVKVLIFGNVDMYLRTYLQTVLTISTLMNMTMRTFMILPAHYRQEHVTRTALAPSQGKRELKMEELLDGRDETIPLSLFDVNEGLTEGVIEVVEDSSSMLGVVERLEAVDASDSDRPSGPAEPKTAERDETSSGIDEDDVTMDESDSILTTSSDAATWRQTEALGPQGVLLVVGDLKSHRNVEAAQAIRALHDIDEERLAYIHSLSAPWHLLLNWTYTIFKLHFSTEAVAKEASLERCRDALHRSATLIREKEPSYSEAMALLKDVFAGRVQNAVERTLGQKERRSSVRIWSPINESVVVEVVEATTKLLFSRKEMDAATLRKDDIGVNVRLFMRDAALAFELLMR